MDYVYKAIRFVVGFSILWAIVVAVLWLSHELDFVWQIVKNIFSSVDQVNVIMIAIPIIIEVLLSLSIVILLFGRKVYKKIVIMWALYTMYIVLSYILIVVMYHH